MSSSSLVATGGFRKGASSRRPRSKAADLRLRMAVSLIETLERRTLLSGLSFGAATTIALGSHTGQNAVVVADVNGDGIPDLVTANADSTISVAIGNGNGTFQTPQYYGG